MRTRPRPLHSSNGGRLAGVDGLVLSELSLTSRDKVGVAASKALASLMSTASTEQQQQQQWQSDNVQMLRQLGAGIFFPRGEFVFACRF